MHIVPIRIHDSDFLDISGGYLLTIRVIRTRLNPLRAIRAGYFKVRPHKSVPFMLGKILLLNGASSSGKSTLARSLQRRLPLPFWHYSIDHLIAAEVLPRSRIDSGEFPWPSLRQEFFEGFHRSIPALAAAGNNLIVEHIIETQTWMHRLLDLLTDYDVFFVGVHCPVEELERREQLRGNRRIGEARADFEVAHTFGQYDYECSSVEAADVVVEQVIGAWASRSQPSAFTRMHRDPKLWPQPRKAR